MGYTQLTLDPNNFTFTSELQIGDLAIQHLANIIDPSSSDITRILGSDGSLTGNGAITIRHTFNVPQFLNKVTVNWEDSTGAVGKLFFYDINNTQIGGEITSFDKSNGDQSGTYTQPTTNPIRIKYFEIVLTGGHSSMFDNTAAVGIEYIQAFIPDDLDRYLYKDYNVEFDDSLLDMASWKNSRYEGSKLTGAQINYHDRDSDPKYPYGMKPVIENKVCALFIATNVQEGEATSSLDPLVEIDNHSYITIDTILLVNRDTLKSTKISHEQFNESKEKKESFRRLISDNFPEGSKIVTKILDIATQTQLKESHRVKFNQGLLMKLYSYTANTGSVDGAGIEDGVFGGFGVRDQKGTLTNDIASGSEASDGTGGGLFGFGTTMAESASLFNTSSIILVDDFPSELSLYGNIISQIDSLNPTTAPTTPTTTGGGYEFEQHLEIE